MTQTAQQTRPDLINHCVSLITISAARSFEDFPGGKALMRDTGSRICTRGMNVNFNQFAHSQHERTRVFDSPLYIRNREVSVGGPVIRENIYADGHRQFVVTPVNGKDSVNLNA